MARTPAGRLIRPKHRDAEVIWSDRCWHPVTVTAWYRLPEPYKSIMTDRVSEWSVRLRFGDGSEAWHLFDERFLRPVDR